MSASRTAPRVSRSPNGVNAKPIWLALTPDERKKVEQRAARDSRSISAMARVLLLKGLAAEEAER